MPLIKPEIQKVLREVGLQKEEAEGTISEKLAAAGLSDDQLAEELVGIAKHNGNDALRLRALETVSKLRGHMKEQNQTQIPSFTIVISPSGTGTQPPAVNPILFPRQSLDSTVNVKVTTTEKVD